MDLFRRLILLFFSMLALCAASAESIPDLTRGKIIVPDEIPGVETLTAEAVIEKANSNHKLVIIDARISRDRASGFIEESLSLPDINTSCDTLNKLVEDKQTPIVFYCNGVKCGRSVIAIKIAKSCGYKRLSWFRGGFEEWQEKGYQTVTQNQHHR